MRLTVAVAYRHAGYNVCTGWPDNNMA